ncbi:MAG: hypothetical protein ABEH65_10810 [Halobacteriales archaeon]
MDLEDLRAVQTDERSADSLQPLPDSFYADVGEFIEGLREQRDRAAERADDPFGSDEVRQLTDEIETAEEVVEAIYERRVGKVVKRASLAAAGLETDKEGLTAEETDLFDQLVECIQDNRKRVLDVLAGELDVTDPDGAPVSTTTVSDEEGSSAPHQSTDSPFETARSTAETSPIETEAADAADEELDIAEAMASDASTDGGTTAVEPSVDADSSAPDGATAETADPTVSPSASDGSAGGTEQPTTAADRASDTDGTTDRVAVRITQDVGEILGTDERVYDLESEDVVTLPTANAEALLERDAAEPVR